MSAKRPSDPRTAIVTGGTSGIGLAIAQRLGADGAAVAVFEIHAEAAEAAADKIRGCDATATATQADVTDRAEVAAERRGEACELV